ncbi:UNKNOWN [Stylonychia lemnae]|uniref:Leucine rich repeat family protein n=1 Tax=Stylonychia lemnae TaxID=5949 RepID=A0A078AS79_STYLE|nr:UNKNOWN [Stylonychia lemnae]|eukprot:CDW83748.1 UNKNOWN [Stylonychia lemnae]
MTQASNLYGTNQGGGGMNDVGQRRPLAMQKRQNQNYQKYMDKMNEALNKNIEKNIFPYWRNHQSLKGWCSMNYPSILTNPTIRRPQPQPDYEKYKFSNQERPISAPNIKVQRPFSTKTFGGQFFQSKGLLHGNQSIDKISYLGSIHSGNGGLQLGQNLHAGRSVANLSQVEGSAIGTVEKIVASLPQPKRPGTTKQPAKKEGEGGVTMTDKKQTTMSALQVIPEKKIPQNETNESALKQTTSWANYQQIQKKLSVGTVTTTKYQERTQIFDQLNDKAREYSSILPQQNYFGQTPDPMKDPYNRRKVKQLNDISFEESEDEDEFEDVKNLKRLPRTVITEESLKQYLGSETEKVNLEHHYWLKDNFIDKIGRMAPNLRELCIRRLKISNRAFSEIVMNLRKLENIDISDCPNIHYSGMHILLDNNKCLKQIQTSNNPMAINDDVVAKIAGYENLTFLDICHATNVTDHGLLGFRDKILPISQLFISGLISATSVGINDIINCCKETLKILEAALMNQDSLQGAFCQSLAFAFHLEELDLTGDINIGDESIAQLAKGDIKLESGQSQVIGLQKLKILKFSGIARLSDHTLIKVCNNSHVLEHIELTKCEGLTEYSIDHIIKNTTTLKFIDLNNIPAITPQVLEQLKQIKPDLLIRRYLYQVVDPKDNQLRVPRRLAGDKKKKKKKGGGKKKKK